GNVDVRRLEQLLADGRAELVELLSHRIGGVAEERRAGKRETVAVDAVAAHPDDDVAFLDGAAVDDLVERYAPDRHADEIEALDDVLQLRGLAAGNRNPRHLGAGA